MGTPQNSQTGNGLVGYDPLAKVADSKYRFIAQKQARGQTLSQDEADFKNAYEGLAAIRALQQNSGAAPASPAKIDYTNLAAQHGGNPQEAEQPGFWERLGQSFGLPTSRKEVEAIAASEEALPWYQKMLPHQPGSSPTKTDSVLGTLAGPAYPLVKGYGQTALKGWKEGIQEAFDTGEDLGRGYITPGQAAGKGGAAAMHTFLQSIPIVGPTLENYGQDIMQGNYRGAAGSGLGFAAQVLGPKAVKAAVPRVAAMVPSAERAGQLLNEVRTAASNVPVDTTAPGSTALEMDRVAQAGGSMPPVAREFLNRITDPNKPPLTFPEARDFYSNASNMAQEKLTPDMRRMADQFRLDLGKAVEDAAGRAGQQDNYLNAMRQYQNLGALENVQDSLIDALKKRLPWFAAGLVTKKLMDAASSKPGQSGK